MSIPDPAERQDIINEPQEHDNDSVAITYIQAMKCAAIAGALARGHVGYADAGMAVEKFLQATAFDVIFGTGVMPLDSAAEAWAEIQAAPWPAAGAPREQPE